MRREFKVFQQIRKNRFLSNPFFLFTLFACFIFPGGIGVARSDSLRIYIRGVSLIHAQHVFSFFFFECNICRYVYYLLYQTCV
jgi:hypothetical protein